MKTSSKLIEQKPQITYNEFKMWLQGLIEGKQGALPDFADWKRIKDMMDRVKPDVVQIPVFPQEPLIRPASPYYPDFYPPYYPPSVSPWPELPQPAKIWYTITTY